MLTRAESITLSIELWTWVAQEDSRRKEDWPGWAKYPETKYHCFLCQYAYDLAKGINFDDFCKLCPYYIKHNKNCLRPWLKYYGNPTKETAQAMLNKIKAIPLDPPFCPICSKAWSQHT